MEFTFSDFSAPWFERPFFDEAAKQDQEPHIVRLAEDFRRDGYLKLALDFDPATLDAVEAETRALHGCARRVQHLWRRSAAIRDLACAPQVLSLLSALYGRRAFPFQTLNFPIGTQQRTHSDTFHFHSAPSRYMCGVWVALEDIDEDNGPLHYFPGSHALPIFTLEDIGSHHYGDYETYVAKLLHRCGFKKELGLMKRGEVLIWSANLFHGGERIKDPARTRLSQVTHYYFDDCMYFTPRLKESPFSKGRLRYPYDFSQNRFIKNRHFDGYVDVSFRDRLSNWRAVYMKHTPTTPVKS
ncbi:phytanoyl-CoA dioxygenase family protein [Hyphococcus flavus]|uniref:Phytanoyl-CoA dioxygenase family protein n=1 Tax=Hyphococcus flavus TaxID=1866326 RepID=A0AAE9ZEB4_9PROT|nr:phytanoyl-CoA dioxygenase family protein [Hyphococcus flavus]WDI32165.1 phytanoyl-CoA dioxygenase family protein [Hyphococcus flavus]